MKISFILVSIITALSIFLPYFLLMAIGLKNNKNQKDLFNSILKRENLSPEFKEQWNQNFIALDKSKNTLIFIKLKDEGHSVNKVNIGNLKSCLINKTTKNFTLGNHRNTELQTLDLELSFLINEEVCALNFYDAKEQFLQDFEIKRAEKWKALIEQSKPKPIFYKSAA